MCFLLVYFCSIFKPSNLQAEAHKGSSTGLADKSTCPMWKGSGVKCLLPSRSELIQCSLTSPIRIHLRYLKICKSFCGLALKTISDPSSMNQHFFFLKFGDFRQQESYEELYAERYIIECLYFLGLQVQKSSKL